VCFLTSVSQRRINSSLPILTSTSKTLIRCAQHGDEPSPFRRGGQRVTHTASQRDGKEHAGQTQPLSANSGRYVTSTEFLWQTPRGRSHRSLPGDPEKASEVAGRSPGQRAAAVPQDACLPEHERGAPKRARERGGPGGRHGETARGHLYGSRAAGGRRYL